MLLLRGHFSNDTKACGFSVWQCATRNSELANTAARMFLAHPLQRDILRPQRNSAAIGQVPAQPLVSQRQG